MSGDSVHLRWFVPLPASCADLTPGGTFDQCRRVLICSFPIPSGGGVSVMENDHTSSAFQSCVAPLCGEACSELCTPIWGVYCLERVGWFVFASGLIHIKRHVGVRIHVLNYLSVRKRSVTKLDGTFCCSSSAKADGSVWNLLCCQGYKQCQEAVHCQFGNANWKRVSFLIHLRKEGGEGSIYAPFSAFILDDFLLQTFDSRNYILDAAILNCYAM